MKFYLLISSAILFSFSASYSQDLSLSLDLSRASSSITGLGVQQDGSGFSPIIGLDYDLSIGDNTSITAGLNYSPIRLSTDNVTIFDLNLVPMQSSATSVTTRNTLSLPVTYMISFGKLSAGAGYQVNYILSASVSLSGVVDLDMDGVFEPFSQDNSISLDSRVNHGPTIMINYQLTPKIELSAHGFTAIAGINGDLVQGSSSFNIYALGLNYGL